MAKFRCFNFVAALFLTHFALSQTLSKETVVVETPHGTMKLKLYEETPLHKANFLKLVKQGYFDSLLFHRVISNFMIQGGDHLSKNAKQGDSLGHGDIGYTVPAEFNEKLIHKKEPFVRPEKATILTLPLSRVPLNFILYKEKFVHWRILKRSKIVSTARVIPMLQER